MSYSTKPLLEGYTAHSTRKRSASWADGYAISVTDICLQASLSSSLIVVKHYKLTLPYIQFQLFMLWLS